MSIGSNWAPDAVILGAPKAGTTGMFRYLADHDGVVGSTEKEPHFFCSDFPELSKVDSPTEYRDLFVGANNDVRTIEASVWYLYSQDAVANIEEISKGVTRYVVALRNPADLAVSLHGQLLRTFQEDVDDFATAWSLQETRSQGDELPRHCPEPALLQYRDAISFGEQIERLLGQVDRNRIHFVDQRSLAQDTRAVYLDLLNFLDLSDDGRTEFEHTNPSRLLRSKWLVSRLRNPNRFEAWLIDTVNPALKRRGVHPLAVIRPYITKVEPLPQVDEMLLTDIEQELHDDLALVRKLTGIDLTKRAPLDTVD